MAGDTKASRWVWIAGAAIATFVILSVLPTSVLNEAVGVCLGTGADPTLCLAPVHATAELTGSRVTDLTMSMTITAKVILALIVAGGVAFVLLGRTGVYPIETPGAGTSQQSEPKPSLAPVVVDVGARARLQAKAVQIAASVCHYWEHGASVDVAYSDGRIELDTTLYPSVDNAVLDNGKKYDTRYKDMKGRNWRFVVAGENCVRLIVQPSASHSVRVFEMDQPSEWIGSIVVAPAGSSKFVGLLRLRDDIPRDRNAKLIDRATRLFVGHSGGINVRMMTDAEADEYSSMLPNIQPSQ